MKAEDRLLNVIYDNLKNGMKYSIFRSWDYYNDEPLQYPFFDTILYYDSIKNLFYWSCFGNSANKATKKELKWILTNIFKCTAKEFIPVSYTHLTLPTKRIV